MDARCLAVVVRPMYALSFLLYYFSCYVVVVVVVVDDDEEAACRQSVERFAGWVRPVSCDDEVDSSEEALNVQDFACRCNVRAPRTPAFRHCDAMFRFRFVYCCVVTIVFCWSSTQGKRKLWLRVSLVSREPS